MGGQEMLACISDKHEATSIFFEKKNATYKIASNRFAHGLLILAVEKAAGNAKIPWASLLLWWPEQVTPPVQAFHVRQAAQKLTGPRDFCITSSFPHR